MARGYSGYLDGLIGKRMSKFFLQVFPLGIKHLSPYADFCALLITLFLTTILSLGAKESTRVNNVFTCLNVGVVLFVTSLGTFPFHSFSFGEQEETPRSEI